MPWRRRLGNRLARAGRERLATVRDHLPLARNELQGLGHVLAELVQSAAATRARRGRRIDDALARQMLGQRPASHLLPYRRAAARVARAPRCVPTIARTARAAA